MGGYALSRTMHKNEPLPDAVSQPRDRVFFDVHEQIVDFRENHGCTSIFEFRTRYPPAEHPDARHKRRGLLATTTALET